MPIHDWTRVPAGLFHDFRQSWSIRMMDALNWGALPASYYALVERRDDEPEPGSTPSDAARYARRANRISVRHPLGQVVAVIELVSPGNKDSRNALRAFVNKAVAFVRHGVHLLIVDLFPPAPSRDPQGIHKAIWDEFADEPFELPTDRPLTLVAYQSGNDYTAYLEFVGIGDPLPDMPLFLTRDEHVLVPLEATYAATWAACPAPIRELVQTGG